MFARKVPRVENTQECRISEKKDLKLNTRKILKQLSLQLKRQYRQTMLRYYKLDHKKGKGCSEVLAFSSALNDMMFQVFLNKVNPKFFVLITDSIPLNTITKAVHVPTDVICYASAQISKQVKVMLATTLLNPEWKK